MPCTQHHPEPRTIRSHDDRYQVSVCAHCGAWSSNLMPQAGIDPQASPAAMQQLREQRRNERATRR